MCMESYFTLSLNFTCFGHLYLCYNFVYKQVEAILTDFGVSISLLLEKYNEMF